MTKKTCVYLSSQIKNWEKRWFDQGNSSFGLMQQAAWSACQYLIPILKDKHSIAIWCGAGNNGGDGYLLASYLKNTFKHHEILVIQAHTPTSPDCQKACQYAQNQGVAISNQVQKARGFRVHIDALFGNGFNKPLDQKNLNLINYFNQLDGLKIALDLPSGLHPDTGIALPACTSCDMTISLMAYKFGLFGGYAKSHVGKLINLELIPTDDQLTAAATIKNNPPKLSNRQGKDSHLHKGDFGSVMVIGGHANMGGATILSGAAAIATGSGRVTIMSHKNHHQAILSRLPNLMLADIENVDINTLSLMDAVCFGMGLGRDLWAKDRFEQVFGSLLEVAKEKPVILDADALWHLANQEYKSKLPDLWIGTPHQAEAARLLGVGVEKVEADRLGSIHRLHQTYGGRWVLKGANSLSLENQQVSICTLGNSGMATAGMGDVLAGLLAGVLAQAPHTSIGEVVALHARCGDILTTKSLQADVNQLPKIATKLLYQATQNKFN